MAELDQATRAKVLKDFAHDKSINRLPFNLSKLDLIAAVNAIDTWTDANAASFNAAIPQPARGALTAKEKARLFMMILNERFKVA